MASETKKDDFDTIPKSSYSSLNDNDVFIELPKFKRLVYK